MLLNFVVELLLLLGADRLYGSTGRYGQIVLGAGINGVYAGACLLLRCAFLRNIGCRILCLLFVAWIAFGVCGNALRQWAVFLLLNLALDGIASSFSKESLFYLLLGAVIVLLMYFLGICKAGSEVYIPVELTYGKKSLQLTALRDTGNTLRDPVTGGSVLVVSADAAQQLTGLTQQQLASPLDAIATAGVPGLRLIPYRTVGEETGFMLALRIKESKIGNQRGSCIVAFAPVGFGKKGAYQALTGGVV